MSWIQENKFVVALAGGTLAGVAGLYFLGSKGISDYQAATEEFTAASEEAAKYEKVVPYPRSDNRDQKRKAVDTYREGIESLQKTFGKFRPAPSTAPLSPQDFASRLKQVNEELGKSFAENNVKIPDNFFSGFPGYRAALPDANSTELLGYQLDAIHAVFTALADSGISELKNVYREALPEERKETWKESPGDVARALPIELTFSGTEKAVRNFITKISATDQRFLVIRVIQVENAKKDKPPLTTDAVFEKAKAAAADNAFSGFFSPEQPASGSGGAAPAPAPAPADTSRVLQQVLGAEQLRVFVRIDVMHLLPEKKLP